MLVRTEGMRLGKILPNRATVPLFLRDSLKERVRGLDFLF